MILKGGHIVYSLPGDPNITHTKEVCGIEPMGLDLQIYVNDIESFPSAFYYANKLDKWFVLFKTGKGGYDCEWREFEGKVTAFKYSTYLA